jgi:hypothetical protein
MKGPYGRLRFDVRRLWQCPVCGRFERTPGSIVTLVCRACGTNSAGSGEVCMKLVEGPPTSSETANEREPSGQSG